MSQILQTVKTITGLSWAFRPGFHADGVKTIGVLVGRDLVGDALIKMPFLRAIHHAFPGAAVHWITSQGPTAYGTVLRSATRELIAVIHECPAWLNPATAHAELQAPYFDILFDTRNHRHAAMMARQVPHGLFLATAMRYLLSDRRPALDRCLWNRPKHICDRLLQLVELAAGYCPAFTGALPLSDELRCKALEILPHGPVYVGLAPGAGNPAKIWPLYKFEKLAALQAARGRVPVFILGPQEMAHYDALRASLPVALFPLQDDRAWQGRSLTIRLQLLKGYPLRLPMIAAWDICWRQLIAD